MLKNVPLLKPSFFTFFLKMKISPISRDAFHQGGVNTWTNNSQSQLMEWENGQWITITSRKKDLFNFWVISGDDMDLTLEKERAVKGNLLNITSFVPGLCIGIMKLKCTLAKKSHSLLSSAVTLRPVSCQEFSAFLPRFVLACCDIQESMESI